MFSALNVSYRKQLRSKVSEIYPKQTADDIFGKIKKEGNFFIIESDLLPFLEKANIPQTKLKDIFAPYGVRNLMITPKQWKIFFDDEFNTAAPPEIIREDILDLYVAILRTFSSAIVSRTHSHPSQRWSYIVSRNPPSAGTSRVRLASLCRLCDEYNLPFPIESFIDAVFDFFQEKIDSLDFEQFSRLMSTFA